MSETLKPIGDRVLILPDEPETMKGKIHFVEHVPAGPKRGRVLQVGKDAPVKVGDYVHFLRSMGRYVPFEGKDLLMLKYEELYAVEE